MRKSGERMKKNKKENTKMDILSEDIFQHELLKWLVVGAYPPVFRKVKNKKNNTNYKNKTKGK
ncbi:MAG: hypothetical protein UZ05_CHB002001058 [Chlorobi bacterium OLB5]|nr:MAG: hypothetical protein UZ05_CHB002001058 [Chlorobi bacterium OLB5]